VRFGDPGREIAAHAEELHAELIVMPSHGRTGLSRLFIGSVAERVVRLAHCPVLILK
jgi:nucleotide-binding universal stress UspA family protein